MVRTEASAPARSTGSRWGGRPGDPLGGVLNEALVALWVLMLALWVLWGVAEATHFHNDEGQYLRRARYFNYLFVEGDLSWRKWGDADATHTHPMLANYIVGGWLWAKGHDVTSLRARLPGEPSPGDDGSAPQRYAIDMNLVTQARQPMVAFGAGAVALLYLLGRALAGRVAGLAAAGLVLFSQLAQEYLVVARAESSLMFFSLLGLLLGLEATRRHPSGHLPAPWAATLGLALGLALAAKLTAALSLAAVAVWGALMAVQAARRDRAASPTNRLRQAWRAGRGWALALVVAVDLFVASNPHLYPDPLLHTMHLVEHRSDELERQQGERPAQAVENPLERPVRVLIGSLIDGVGVGSRGLPLEAVLAALGLTALGRRARQRWRHEHHFGTEAWVILVVLVYYVGTSIPLSIVWRRYFIPTLLLGTLLSGLGVGVIVRQILGPPTSVGGPRHRALKASPRPR